jgi:hypothetical protein
MREFEGRVIDLGLLFHGMSGALLSRYYFRQSPFWVLCRPVMSRFSLQNQEFQCGELSVSFL